MAITTIQIDTSLKDKLEKLKIHHRETYNELLLRLISTNSPQNVDRESLIETIEVLSDPEMMQGIAQGIKDIREGNSFTLEEIKKEIGIK
ncbi:hypothetical protein KAI32_03580 [Candidatus Pacearchaeota archaeon]|nr:hypothetical protein [Candidatus Pacearchaeota archaeon]